MRRFLWTTLVLLLGLLLLVLLAPTLVTSDFVIGKVASAASEKLGRPVEIEGVEFGWRTPLSLERLAIPAASDDEGFPIMIVEGVRVPLSLGDLLGGLPISLSGIEVDKLELNAVRPAELDWNILRLAEKFATTEPTEPEPEEPAGPLPPMPLKDLKVSFKQIDIRAVDRQLGYLAGWEEGNVEIEWSGGENALTMEVGGDLRVNDERLPWDVRLKASHWVDAAGTLTPDQTELVFSSDGMVNENQISDGGFFLSLNAPVGQKSVARVHVPLSQFSPMLRQFPVATKASPMRGDVDWRLEAERITEDKAQITTTFTTKGIQAGELKEFPDILFAADTTATISKKLIDDLTMHLESGGVKVAVEMSGLRADAPMETKFANLTLDFDLAAVTRESARWRDGADPMLEGPAHIEFHWKPDPHSKTGHIVQVDSSTGPLTLKTLEPYTKDPDFMTSGPIVLLPNPGTLAALAQFDQATKEFRLQDSRLTAPSIDMTIAARTHPKGEETEWESRVKGTWDVSEFWKILDDRFKPEGLSVNAGKLDFDLLTSGVGGSEIDSSGTLSLNSLELTVPDRPLPVALSETKANWDLSASPDDLEVEIRELAMETPFASLSANGTAGYEPDLSGELQVSFDRLMEFAEPFGPFPFEFGGAMASQFSVRGEVGKELSIEIALDTPESIRFVQPEMLTFESPVSVASQTKVTWTDGVPTAVDVALDHATIGDIADTSGTLKLNMTEFGSLMLDGSGWVDYEHCIGLVDPAMWESMDLALNAAGRTSVELKVDGPMSFGPAGVSFPGEWTIGGNVQTRVEALEWIMGEMGELITGISDDREFHVSLHPDNPMGAVYQDKARSGIASIEGPMDMAIAGLEWGSAVDFSMERASTFGISDGIMESLYFPSAAAEVSLPVTRFGADMGIDMTTSEFELLGSSIDLEGIGVQYSAAAFNWATMDWTTSMTTALSDIGGLLATTTMGGEPLPMLSSADGAATATVQLAGRVSPEPFSFDSGLPLQGNIDVAADNMSITLQNGLEIDGMSASGGVTLGDDHKTILTRARLAMDYVGGGPMDRAPIEGFAMGGRFEMRDFDIATIGLDEFRADSFGTSAAFACSIEGLRAIMDGDRPEGAASWINALRIDGSADFRQDFGPLDGFLRDLKCSGVMEYSAAIHGAPGESLQLTSDFKSEQFSLGWAELFSLQDMTGSLSASKTWYAADQRRSMTSPPAGTLRIARISSVEEPWHVDIEGMTIRARGIEEGLTADVSMRKFLGGPVTSTWTLGLRDGDPVFTGRAQVTGMNMGNLAPQLGKAGDPASEISAIATMQWRLPLEAQSRAIEELGLQMQSTRIGRTAMLRILSTWDSTQEDPRFQNALSAISLGTLTGASFVMENALVTFNATVGIGAGIQMPVPILDRQPVGDALKVYGMERNMENLDMVRRGLLLLLAPDLESFEKSLSEMELSS